ncbi:MAG: IS200/IS605 family accessory protein TnpB-related protein, partial [Leptolyngbyaceae cyanobacterium]
IYRKCQNINTQIGHIVSTQIVALAEQFNADAIVFEHLKGWKPRGGRKRSPLRQRFHGWLKSRIAQWTEEKWAERGGKTVYVVARGTSSHAYDGSGTVKRNTQNYALSVFPTGKQYNADLNGAHNIAARGIMKLTGRKDRQDAGGKRTPSSPRNRAVLCDLWGRDTLKLA